MKPIKRSFIATGALAGILLATSGCGAMRQPAQAGTAAPSGPVSVSGEAGVVPAGTSFTVRTNQEIKTEQAGGTYSAEVAQDIQDANGNILVPRGSSAELAVVQVSSGGTVGTPTMELALRSLTVNGTRHEIATDREAARGNEGLGANRRTAEMTGGGAVLGTLIGAAAGGARGAAVGAAIGAAGGATAQVLTRGKEIQVPPETLLTFRLEQSLRLS